jgi:antitoxin component YwqK of YwqJK toxin-antitoxin module
MEHNILLINLNFFVTFIQNIINMANIILKINKEFSDYMGYYYPRHKYMPIVSAQFNETSDTYSIYSHDIYGNKCGVEFIWNKQGKLICKRHYDENKLHGMYEQWDHNKIPIYRLQFWNGELDGMQFTFHSNGNPALECMYLLGDISSSYYKEYSSDGTVIKDPKMKKGRQLAVLCNKM